VRLVGFIKKKFIFYDSLELVTFRPVGI